MRTMIDIEEGQMLRSRLDAAQALGTQIIAKVQFREWAAANADGLLAAAEKLEKLCEKLNNIEWVEDVDVNGEYMTRRWRPGMEIKSEIMKMVTFVRENNEG